MFFLLFCFVWQPNLQWSACLRALMSDHEQMKPGMQKLGEHLQFKNFTHFQLRTFLPSSTPLAKKICSLSLLFSKPGLQKFANYKSSDPSRDQTERLSDVIRENVTLVKEVFVWQAAHSLTHIRRLSVRSQKKCPQKNQITYSTLDVHADEVRCFRPNRGENRPHISALSGANFSRWKPKLLN